MSCLGCFHSCFVIAATLILTPVLLFIGLFKVGLVVLLVAAAFVLLFLRPGKR